MSLWFIGGLIWLVLIVGAWASLVLLPKPDADAEAAAKKRLQRWVQFEIDKAMAGAVNADQWAKDLAAAWRKKL